jgi:hypothetical protein
MEALGLDLRDDGSQEDHGEDAVPTR